VDKQSIRRRLLIAGVYTPPVILGTMIIGPRHALGQVETCNMNPGLNGTPTTNVTLTISSGSNACCPCVPNSTEYNVTKCDKSQSKKTGGEVHHSYE